MTNEEMTEMMKKAWPELLAFAEKHTHPAWEIIELKPQNIIEPTEWTWKQENTVIDPDGNAICEEVKDE